MKTNDFVKQELKTATYYCKLLVKQSKKMKVYMQLNGDEMYISDGCFIYRFASCLVDAVQVLVKAFGIDLTVGDFIKTFHNGILLDSDYNFATEYNNFVAKINEKTALYRGLKFESDENIVILEEEKKLTFVKEKYFEPYKSNLFSVSEGGVQGYNPVVCNMATSGVVILPIKLDTRSALLVALQGVADRM